MSDSNADALPTDTSRGSIVVYDSPDGEVHIDVRFDGDTVWLTLQQIADLFDRDKSVISRHLRSIYTAAELSEQATVAKIATVRNESGRQVSRTLEYYNLDAILSVGYRVNSKRGTQFRIWATNTLRNHLVNGFTLHKTRIEKNAQELERVLKLVQATANQSSLTTSEARGLVNLIARYTRTFALLHKFDQGALDETEDHVSGDLPSPDEASEAITQLKAELMRRREASDLFGRERDGGLKAILGNLNQTVIGKPAYPTLKSKAAHLLYFVIKNHPFTDGNKRIGSFLFIDFLRRNDRLFNGTEPVINDAGLTALALLIAESNPKDMDIMIRLVMNMLSREQSP